MNSILRCGAIVMLVMCMAIPVRAQFLSVTLDAPVDDPVTGNELRLGAAMMLILASDSGPSGLDFGSSFFISGNDTLLSFATGFNNPFCYFDSQILKVYGITDYPITYAGMPIDYIAHGFASGQTVSIYARFFNNLAGTPPSGLAMPQGGSFDESGTLRKYLYGDYNDLYFADTELFSFKMPSSMVDDAMMIIPEDFSMTIDTSRLVWQKGYSDENADVPDIVPYTDPDPVAQSPEPEPEPVSDPQPDQPPATSPASQPEPEIEPDPTPEPEPVAVPEPEPQIETPQEPEPDIKIPQDTQPELESDVESDTESKELPLLEDVVILSFAELKTTFDTRREYLTTHGETQLDPYAPAMPEPGAVLLTAWGILFLLRRNLRRRR